jgi:hypothetical protein
MRVPLDLTGVEEIRRTEIFFCLIPPQATPTTQRIVGRGKRGTTRLSQVPWLPIEERGGV